MLTCLICCTTPSSTISWGAHTLLHISTPSHSSDFIKMLNWNESFGMTVTRAIVYRHEPATKTLCIRTHRGVARVHPPFLHSGCRQLSTASPCHLHLSLGALFEFWCQLYYKFDYKTQRRRKKKSRAHTRAKWDAIMMLRRRGTTNEKQSLFPPLSKRRQRARWPNIFFGKCNT